MSRVIIRQADYDNKLTDTIYAMMDRLAKPKLFAGARVLVKPNLLRPADPAQAILTHPMGVRAVSQYVLEAGGRVQVSDSPAVGSFRSILHKGGYVAACRGLDIDFKPFEATRLVDIGPPYGRIELAADALDADVLINLPKLKTHVLTHLTIGVKNLFGCIVGFQKPQWHLRAGTHIDHFSGLLVRICQRINPAITLVDGILGMEGQGPGKSGLPRKLGLLIGGGQPEAVDQTICRILGCSPMALPTHRAAQVMGSVPVSIRVEGSLPRIPDFKFPVADKLLGMGPKTFQRTMRKHLLKRPVPNTDLCQLCGQCALQCPATAITNLPEKLQFDYDSCIRCYCCLEICPFGALRATDTLAGKMIHQISDWFTHAIGHLRPGR